MSGNSWVMLIPNNIFSRIKNEFSASMKTKYGMKDSNFTDEATDTPSKFPLVYVHMLSPSEVGQTLDGKSINGGLFTFQIEVYDNAKKSTALDVMSEVLRIMKKMRFEVVGMPEHFKTDTHRYVMRCRRVIGATDSI